MSLNKIISGKNKCRKGKKETKPQHSYLCRPGIQTSECSVSAENGLVTETWEFVTAANGTSTQTFLHSYILDIRKWRP